MWIYRARDLHIITEHHFREWCIRFRKYGHKQEPDESIATEKPPPLSNMIFRALAEEQISASRAAELLGRPVETVRKRMQISELAVVRPCAAVKGGRKKSKRNSRPYVMRGLPAAITGAKASSTAKSILFRTWILGLLENHWGRGYS